MKTLTQIKWIVLLVCFASQAQQQEAKNNPHNIIVKPTNIDCVIKTPGLITNNVQCKLPTVASLVSTSSSNSYTVSGQMTYKEMELLPNAGVTRFVKIEFAGKQIKGFKDFYAKTMV
jgi:hypothetical protein